MEFQKEEINDIFNIFKEESQEIISSMDDKLLELDKSGKNPDLIIKLFRDAHSLKGSARMLGLDDIQNLAHKIEDIISFIKEDKIEINSKITDTISECLGFILNLVIKTAEKKEEFKSPDTILYIEKLNNLTENIKEEKLEKNEEKEKIKEGEKQELKTTSNDILSAIANTQIKTLRVDSTKMDNLVGQIQELIVSKIKTNEEITLAKKINNDMLDWQKNFSKMEYYIKYFDKKYLSNPDDTEWDYRQIVAYNRQLNSLATSHSEKILSLIKDMSNLFKQLQESESKLNSTTNEIDTMVKNMRILPLSTIFQLFPRMVHNIARDRGKEIELIIKGSDITADKSIIEEIKTPLIHIIRNSIDHGIEDSKTREEKGKPKKGKIEIEARMLDNRIIIDIKDDGRGLDIEKIKKKALEKKLLTYEELNSINEEELTNLIFYPGFSTEDFVTELSGRGLGLDIVNSKITELQGRVDVFSQYNQGMIVRLVVPSTVATKKVFILEEQEQFYALETSVIKTILRIDSSSIYEKDGNSYFIYDNSSIPIYTLSQILNLEKTIKETQKYTLMIIQIENKTFGIIVEKLISDQEIVHKKLSPPLYKVQNISGITTLANGEACLILNISDIISTINSKKIGIKVISKRGIIKSKENSSYKVLVVDDSHTTRILEKNILTNNGYSASSATNATSALEKLQKDNFDLIVTDIQMPGMNGFEFIQELRKIEGYENCPVIVVSSLDRENCKREIIKLGISSYIQKSEFRQEDFISRVRNILS